MQTFSLLLDPKGLAQAFSSGDSKELLNQINGYLSGFAKVYLPALTPAQANAIDQSAESIAYYLSRDLGTIPRAGVMMLLRHHQALTNVFAVSSYRSSDDFVKTALRKDRANILLRLMLGPRNTVRNNLSKLLDTAQDLASEWYGQYLFGARAFPNQLVCDNLRAHLATWDERLACSATVSNGYMRSTYLGVDLDRQWKHRFNQLVRAKLSSNNVINRPDPNHIAIATGRWAPVHPTYKNRLPMFKELAKHYRLSLVHIGPERKDLETSLFEKVYNVQLKSGSIDLSSILNNDFGAFYYPDIGMNIESRFMSNIRFAPVQLTTNSHPASTFGSEIDYFLTGVDAEEPPDIAHRNYSERLVLIPGIGTQPLYPSDIPARTSGSNDGLRPLIIGCPWGGLKINHELVCRLKRLIQEQPRAVKFRFMVTLGRDAGHFLPVLYDLQEILGKDHVEMSSDLQYPLYMEQLAGCDFALDAFPFGGNTSIVDCMALGIPIIAQKGWQFYNRAGPVILERFGLEELVATSEESYHNIALRLISEPNHLQTLSQRIAQTDVRGKLQGLTSADAFVKALRYLIKHRPDPMVRTPLVFND